MRECLLVVEEDNLAKLELCGLATQRNLRVMNAWKGVHRCCIAFCLLGRAREGFASG